MRDDEPEAASEPEPEAKTEPEEKPKKQQESPRDDTPKEAPEGEATGESKADATDDVHDASAYVTPLVRKLAADHGIDLSSLKGTGVGGRIRKQDVLDAAKAAEEPEPEQQPAGPPSDTAPAPQQTAPAPR